MTYIFFVLSVCVWFCLSVYLPVFLSSNTCMLFVCLFVISLASWAKTVILSAQCYLWLGIINVSQLSFLCETLNPVVWPNFRNRRSEPSLWAQDIGAVFARCQNSMKQSSFSRTFIEMGEVVLSPYVPLDTVLQFVNNEIPKICATNIIVA